MVIEKTEIWITCEKSMTITNDTVAICDELAIRGFFENLYKIRPEFHGGLYVYKIDGA